MVLATQVMRHKMVFHAISASHSMRDYAVGRQHEVYPHSFLYLFPTIQVPLLSHSSNGFSALINCQFTRQIPGFMLQFSQLSFLFL